MNKSKDEYWLDFPVKLAQVAGPDWAGCARSRLLSPWPSFHHLSGFQPNQTQVYTPSMNLCSWSSKSTDLCQHVYDAAVSASVIIWVPKLGESKSGQMVSKKREMSIIWFISITNNVKSNKQKITETAQTANFSDFPLIFGGNGPKSTKIMQTPTPFFLRLEGIHYIHRFALPKVTFPC